MKSTGQDFEGVGVFAKAWQLASGQCAGWLHFTACSLGYGLWVQALTERLRLRSTRAYLPVRQDGSLHPHERKLILGEINSYLLDGLNA
jgi:hypothetical protein